MNMWFPWKQGVASGMTELQADMVQNSNGICKPNKAADGQRWLYADRERSKEYDLLKCDGL